LDFAEKNGYIRGVVREIIHDSGRWVLFYLFANGGSVLEEDGVDRVENEVLRIRCRAGEFKLGRGMNWRSRIGAHEPC
jgi:hypothetical protein